MQNAIIRIIEIPSGMKAPDARTSFRGFIEFVKQRRQVEKTQIVKYLDFLIHYFEERLQGKDELTEEELPQYRDLFEYMYSAICPPLSDEGENLWALSVPVMPVIVFGTDAFYRLMIDPVTREIMVSMIEGKEERRDPMNLELIYSVILQRQYGYAFSAGDTLMKSFKNLKTGLPSFYRLYIDTRFIEVSVEGERPPFDPADFELPRSKEEVIEWLKEHLPLGLFRFRGFTAVTLADVTKSFVLNDMREVLLDEAKITDGSPQQDVLQHLRTLGGTLEADYGLMPFFRVNGRPVFSGESCHHSLFSEAAGSDGRRTGAYLALAEKFYREPRLLLHEVLPDPSESDSFFLAMLRRKGIQGYSLVPVYHNTELVGVMELSSRKEGVVNKALLARLEEALPLLAQLLQRSTDEFDRRIKALVKENFTSIQPAVEWKFNEAAWRFEQQRERRETPVMENIYFAGVSPLYGAIDIRNSTIERNGALRRDLQRQFGLLSETLEALQRVAKLDLLDELIFQSQKWEKALTGALTTAEELRLNNFLSGEAEEFLLHFARSRPDVLELIEPYRKATDPETGIAFENRRNLETSIQRINQAVNQHLDAAAEELQRTYPCYFEKFRTDGVEYDIYAGQGISPDRSFDVLYLRNLRLWQLNSMIAIVRLTGALEMPIPLQTTQLIFVHSAPIDISFRKDERRFDVEGGYNIRYQVVKKRIDKVHVLDTNERLTQPGTVSIIYFDEKEAEEYAGYIKYLQETGSLKDTIEYLELEELQGVSGLRALRVKVQV
jgi:hypothetical protein